MDGVMIASVTNEISKLIGGRIDKITQPEKDEIILMIRAGGANHKVLITSQANAPRINFTTQSKVSPLTAPMFCMVLRKHISAGRILAIRQPDFERIVEVDIEALDEMGDRGIKTLVVEIMGKHSNIMLVDGNGKVLDAIKHVPPSVSAARPILPGAVYSRPPGNKLNPLTVSFDDFIKKLTGNNVEIQKALYLGFNGVSPILANEICFLSNISPEILVNDLENKTKLFETFECIFKNILENKFENNIFSLKESFDISAIKISVSENNKSFESPSNMFEAFYTKRDEVFRVRQKTVDLRKLVTTHEERARKKAIAFTKTMEDIKDRDDLRIKGELLTSYLYMVKSGEDKFIAENFYDENKPITIKIDPALSPTENAQKYFKKYNKQKRTFVALQDQITKNQEELAYLESVLISMETITDEADIAEIRHELAEQGFVKRKTSVKNKKAQKSSGPQKYLTSDGFEMYVGKNNTQNDYLTLRQARANDLWFHTKDIPGSHVILMTAGKEPTKTAILEAANLAAYHSKAKTSSQVPVDYVTKKNVRKPNGAKPGFVIYDNHNTVYVTPTAP